MIGKISPLFEKCPADPASGLIFRQCRVDSSFSAIIVATVVLSAGTRHLCVGEQQKAEIKKCSFTLIRWTRRRLLSLLFSLIHSGAGPKDVMGL
jgi:hypothetical protein